ncbi:MAG: DedA family protein [Sphingomonadales bacterium]|nr:DedA family protein [Sphingomonadales bacterium]
MNDIILRLIEQGGYWGIAFLMVIENVFPPIPSEVIMGLGGVAVARGSMTFWPLLLAGTAGSTLGNYVWFLVGDKLGYARLHPFVTRWGRWLTLEWHEVERATAFFRRHGQWIVFAMRFSPFLRTMISLPAGLAHMKHWKFLAFTFAGAAVWNTLLILGGQAIAGYLVQAKHVMDWVLGGIIALVLVAYLWRVIRWSPKD